MQPFTVVFMGGLSDAAGRSAWKQPVLFGTASEAVATYLPHDVPLLQVNDNPETAGSFEEGLASVLSDVSENVLVFAAPLIPTHPNAFQWLIETHDITGYDVTVGTADEFGFAPDGQPLADSERCDVAVFRREQLEQALTTHPATLEALVAAVVDAGANRGVVQLGTYIRVTDGLSAAQATTAFQQQIATRLIQQGVQIFDPLHTYIAPDASIAAGTVILPGCIIRAGCTIGAHTVIGPNTLLEQATIGEGTTVNHSQVYQSTIGDHVTVGPFAYVRPDCTVGDGCRIGDFVELKKAAIGNGTKVSHLTYIGDAVVGERVNFGCGTVVVNYDGYHKYQTTIGDDCFIGCNTNLVSPVTLGDRAFTAAGTTVTKNVPAGALAVARSKQTTLEGWNDRRRALHEQETPKTK